MSHVLFKDTVTVTDLRSPRGNEILGSVVGTDVIRVLHRDKPIKVVITEEFYLSLLTFWQMQAHTAPAKRSRERMKKAAREALDEMTQKVSAKRSAS